MEPANFSNSCAARPPQAGRQGCSVPLTPFDPAVEPKAARIRAQPAPLLGRPAPPHPHQEHARQPPLVAQAKESTGAHDYMLDSDLQGLGPQPPAIWMLAEACRGLSGIIF